MDKLNILWTNADAITFDKMVFMYSVNSLKYDWWKEVRIIIWGATTKLVAENKKVQQQIKEAMEAGVEISACKSCAKELGVINKVQELGIEVKYWGEGLTDILKNDEKLLTV